MTVILVALLASSAVAQSDYGPALGLFFSNGEFTDATTNFEHTPNQPFNAYLVLLNPGDYDYVIGWEARLLLTNGDPLPSSLSGSVNLPGGYSNFGTGPFDHRVQWDEDSTIAISDGGTLLTTFQLTSTSSDPLELALGEPEDASFSSHYGPAVGLARGLEELFIAATTTGGGVAPGPTGPYPVVATLSGDGITPVEQTTLSDVKRLFD
jgi:hypothetical protein